MTIFCVFSVVEDAKTGALSNPNNAIEEEVDVGKEQEKEIFYSKTIPTSYLGTTSENGGSSHFVRCQTLADLQDDNTDAVNLIGRQKEQQQRIITRGRDPRADSSDDNDDDDGDDIEHPGQSSSMLAILLPSDCVPQGIGF
ncbi:hypothetical protein ACFE04_016107 [Oxalis oulophora]